jgi:multicomponent Na+:H+ antiporter subunit D
VTAVFAGLLTKVGVYAMIRVQTLLFPDSPLHSLLMWAALLTMIVGILGAVSQSGLKRILSFTLVSHIGYMVFGIALGTAHGMAGAIFYVVHHITIQTALFLIAGLVERLGGTTSLDRLAGLAFASPVLSVLFFVAAMNLSGIPPLSGFLAKIGLFHAGIEFGTPLSWALVVGGVVTSLLTLYALAKVWSQAFWRPLAETPAPAETAAALASGSLDVPDDVDPASARTTVLTEPASTSRAMPPLMLAATATMTAVGLIITVAAGPLFAYTQRAAADLQQRAPYITTVLPPEVRR